MKKYLITVSLLVCACTSTSTVKEWVDLNGKPAPDQKLELALADCEFERKSRLVKSLRDMAYDEFGPSYSSPRSHTYAGGDYYENVTDSKYYKDAQRLANQIMKCMYDHGFVATTMLEQ